MIIDPEAKTITLKGKNPAPFRIISTYKAHPPDCWACGQPTDKMALISTPAVTSNRVEVPLCSTCLCIYKNGEGSSR